MFRKFGLFAFVCVVFCTALMAVAADNGKIHVIGAKHAILTRVQDTAPAPAVAEDCPNCRLKQRHPLKEVKQAVGNTIQAIKYDAKLDGKELDECKSCQEAKAPCKKETQRHERRGHFRSRFGRRCSC